MHKTRRTLLQLGASLVAGLPTLAHAQDPRMADRSLGAASAPVVCTEYFSLTCTHCATFHKDVIPLVKKEMIEPGKLRMVFAHFPLNQLDLTASAVSRALPPERFESFCGALLASQDRWAFARGIDNIAELWKMAALAGMPRATFDAAVADNALKTAILEAQDRDAKQFSITSTPSFVFNGPGAKNRVEAGGRSYVDFAAIVAKAAG
jgi:protein-disulfide isomerase